MSQSIIFKKMNYSLISSVDLLAHGLSFTLVTPSSLIIGLPMLLSIYCEEQFVGVCLTVVLA
jgi:predicted signal transduction protein with EAL and GGDEF domain